MDVEFLVALLILPFKFAGNALSYIGRRKFLIAIAIIVIVIIVISSMNGKSTSNIPPEQARGVPSIIDAPYVIQTSSRYYYVSNYVDDTKAVTLNNYYSFENGKWVKRLTPLPLDRKYTTVKIIPRKTN